MKVSDIEVTIIDSMGSDLSVVNAARVSFDKESKWEEEWYQDDPEDDGMVKRQYLNDADARLINYLARHKHTSPFNHAFLTFRVKAPIFVARQLVKHRFMPWNEVSRRYVDSEPEFYVPKEWRPKAENVKQGSADESMKHSEYFYHTTVDHCKNALDLYNEHLADGVCPEMARMVLPLNTHTEWIWSGTLGAYADMLKLRLDPHAQYESRIVAEKIKAEVEKLFPVSIESLLENN